MRDLFDDFLEELRRREAIARGEDPDAGAPRRPRAVGPNPDSDGDDRGDGPGTDRDDRDADPARDSARDREPAPREPSPPRRPRPVASEPRRPRRRLGWWAIGLVVLAIFLVSSFGLDLWTDALWFRSVGFDAVFWTRLGAQLALFVGAGLGSLAIILINLAIAGRLAPVGGDGTQTGGSFRSLFERINEAAADPSRGTGRFGPEGPRPVRFGADDIPDLTPIAGVALVGLAGLVALTVGGSMAASWETVLLWVNRVPFSPDTATAVADPIFGRDIGFFLFELPFMRLIQALFNGIVLASLIAVGARYLVGASRGGLTLTTPIRVHVAVLAGLFLLSIAFGTQLDKYELVYSTRGIATGVSFTDQNAQFFAYDVLTLLSGLAGALLVGGAFTRMLWPLGLTVGVWLLASLIIGRAYPEAIQRFTVEPNQFAQEQRYIANNIGMTRLAFGLDDWEDRPFRGEAVLTPDAIAADEATFRNARLWDYRPLADTLDQLQAIRPYYAFKDVDTDRYDIDGVQRQVMLSARELARGDTGTSGFVNERIIYTHGIGAAMVPVNEVANEGQPRLLIGNLPPVSTDGAPVISESRIYFGELETSHVITGARQNEFDYPTGEGEAAATSGAGTATRWTGTTGIKLDTTLMRVLFALRFRDLDLLISDQVTADSQLLMHRFLADRLPRIAPFLQYDKDPYVVIDDAGRMVYVQDAYTTSDRFPHAQAFAPSTLESTTLGRAPINYIRNSVKITMDAYDGTMRFYVADSADPLIRAYSGIFPTLFRPLDEIPDGLRAHLRVPEELFNIQTRVFGRYHVTDTERFFAGNDVWTVPQGQTSEQTLPSEAYYVVMRLPGEPEAEFLLLQPMVPVGRLNMIAWVAARMDEPNYGSTRAYRFPADTTIFGPAQIEARIDQDPIISEQFTLWNQSGSTVIRGNLIVVPIGDSLIYLQPVYLQSTGSAFPEFRRIVVASPREVVWGETLAEALDLLLVAEGGAVPTPSPTPTPDPGATPTPTPEPTSTPDPNEPLPADVAGLIAYANQHFELAQTALRDGDFARYGDEIAKVAAALERLDQLAPELSVPSPAP